MNNLYSYKNNNLVIDFAKLQLLAENKLAYPDKRNELSDITFDSLVPDDVMVAMNKFLLSIGSQVYVTRNAYHNKLYFRHRKVKHSD